MVNCDLQNQGCNGGWLSNSANYLINKGVVSDACMPYDAYDGYSSYCMYRCKSKDQEYKKYGCKWNSMKVLTDHKEI
jgi:hypothetical protein